MFNVGDKVKIIKFPEAEYVDKIGKIVKESEIFDWHVRVEGFMLTVLVFEDEIEAVK